VRLRFFLWVCVSVLMTNDLGQDLHQNRDLGGRHGLGASKSCAAFIAENFAYIS